MTKRTLALVLLLLMTLGAAVAMAEEQTPSEEAATKAYRQGAFSRAVTLYTQALSETTDPHHRAELHVRIAWTLFALGREADVPTHLRAALLEDPNLTLVPDYYTAEFLKLFDRIKSEGAQPSTTPSTTPQPDLEKTVLSVQQRLETGSDLEGALADVESLLHAYPNDGRLLPLKLALLDRLGRTDEAAQLRRQLATASGGASTLSSAPVESMSVPELILRANRLLDEGDVATSLELLRQAVGRQPSNVAALELLAEAAQRDGRWQEAEYALKSALNYQQDNLELQLRLGEVYLAMGDQSAARDVFRQLTQKRPPSDRAWAALGLLDAALLRKDRAIKELATALQENPLLPEVQLAYGELLLAGGKVKQAGEALRSASNLLQDDPQVEGRLGQYLLAKGDSSGAVEPLKAAIAGGFSPPDVSAALVLALASTGNLSEAERELKSLQLDAQHGADLLPGLLAYYRGDLEKALELLRAVAKRRPNDSAVLNLVAATLYRMERYDDAVPLLQRSHELSPNNQVIEKNLQLAQSAAAADQLLKGALGVSEPVSD